MGLYIAPKLIYRDSNILTNPIKSVTNSSENTSNNLGSQNKKLSEIQAWIYPGEPSCNALKELSDGRRIDTIKVEFFRLSELGDLELMTEEDYGCNGYSQKTVDFIKKHSVNRYITVSGDDVRMRKLLSDPAKIDAFISQAKSLVSKSEYTGIEIDFEGYASWSQSDYQKFLDFLKLLGEDLSEDGYKLIVDGPPISNEFNDLFVWNYADFNQPYIHQVVIMAYDYQADYGVGVGVAPADWVTEVVGNALKEIGSGKEKLVVGVPSYGYTGKVGTFDFTLITKDQAMTMPGYNDSQYNRNTSESSWVSNGMYYSYVRSQDLARKVEQVYNLGITKVSIWHLGGNDWFDIDNL